MAQQFVYTVFTAATGTGTDLPGLWSTNGTAAINTNVPDSVFDPYTAGSATSLGFNPGYAMAYLGAGKVVFATRSTVSSDVNINALLGGVQLWVTDGTAAGTMPIYAQVDPTAGNANDTSGFYGFTTWNNRVLFEYNPGSANNDYLYITDGTAAGTIALSNNPIDDASIGPGNGASTGTNFVYAAASGLWLTDGTSNSAVLIKATTPSTTTTPGFQPGHSMAALSNGTVIFGATGVGTSDALGLLDNVQLWAVGPGGGTRMISASGLFADVQYGQAGDTAGLSDFVSIGTRVLFAYEIGAGAPLQLFSTDGTSYLTVQNTGLYIDAASLAPGGGVSTGGKLIFATQAQGDAGGIAGVYTSDGTQAGTTLIKATVQGTASSLGFVPGDQMAALPNGKVVFGATSYGSGSYYQNISSGIQLWVTDGTRAGTTEIYSVPDFSVGQPGDSVRFWNFVSTANGVQFLLNLGQPNNNVMYFTDGTAAGTYQISSQYVDDNSLAIGLGASPLGCFRSGTRLATRSGETPVETLQVGDEVRLDGAEESARVHWIGHRTIDCTRHPDPAAVWPVRVSAGAFGDDRPHRDLFLSPDHAVFINDVLIPIRHLINGTSIAQVPVDAVTYYHVELDRHDILIAEGLPCESYLDVGDRDGFANGGSVIRLFPDLSNRATRAIDVWEAYGRAPLVVTGPLLEAAHAVANARIHLIGADRGWDRSRQSGASR